MIVEDVMVTSLTTATPDEPLQNIAGHMCLYRRPGIPVVKDKVNCELIGFISEKDVLSVVTPSINDVMDNTYTHNTFQLMEDRYFEIEHYEVESVMTTNVISICPDVPIIKALNKMIANKFRRIPVATKNEDSTKTLVGMLSVGDIHKALFKHFIDGK